MRAYPSEKEARDAEFAAALRALNAACTPEAEIRYEMARQRLVEALRLTGEQQAQHVDL